MQPVQFRGRLAGDDNAVGAADGVEFVLDPRYVAAEALHRLDAQVGDRLATGPRQRRHDDGRARHQVRERAIDGVQAGGVADALEEVPALLLQLRRLQECDDRTRRQVVREEAAVGRLAGPGVAVGPQDHEFGLLRQAALGVRGERANRLEFVAEEFEPHGVGGVGGEEIDDAAALGELAGVLDRLAALEAVVVQPE